jgi:peptide/nickel transport system substrate-binding protein
MDAEQRTDRGDRPVARSLGHCVMHRRAALRLLLGGTGLAILSACAPTPPAAPPTQAPAPAPAKPTEAPKPAAAPATAPAAPVAQPTVAPAPPIAAKPTEAAKPAAATPRSGGTLRVGQVGDVVSFDPHFSQSSSYMAWLGYERLTAYDPQFKPQPMLAESWEVSSDAKQITFKLRKNVQFHSGRELTSEDVKYSVTRVLDPKVGVGQFTAQAKWWTSIETPDKYTVILKSDQPRPLMFDFFEYLNMVDQTVLEGPDSKTKSAGTGAFALAEWIQGNRATFEKNTSYWQSGKPYLDKIEVTFLADAQAMSVQFESGAVDIIRTPTKQEFARLRNDPKYQGIIYPNTVSGYAVGANVTTPPLTDKRVRQALSYAIDRKRFVDTLLAGVGKPVSLPWAETFPMYEASKVDRYTFDLEKAKSLLSQAGVSDLTLEITPSPSYPEGGDFCQMYQADLAKIGIKLNIIKQDQAAWSDQINNRKYPHLYYAGSNLNLSPGTIFTVSRPIGPKDNNEGFESERYTKLVADMAQEMDPAKLKPIYSELNDILLDESFFMFISPNYLLELARANIRDITPTMHGRWSYTDTWIA